MVGVAEVVLVEDCTVVEDNDLLEVRLDEELSIVVTDCVESITDPVVLEECVLYVLPVVFDEFETVLSVTVFTVAVEFGRPVTVDV